MKKRVVITGAGAITPIGIGIENSWNSLLSGKTNVEKIPDQWKNYSNYSSEIWSPLPEINFTKYGLTEIEIKQLDKTTLLSIASSFEAFKNAGIEFTLIDPKKNKYELNKINKIRSGVFIGTGIGGVSTLAECFSYQILNNLKNESIDNIKNKMITPKRFNPFAVSMIMSNASAANIGIKFGLNGPNRTFTAACASGTQAIGNAYNAIINNEIDFAVAGGTEYMFDQYGALFYAFDAIKALVKADQKDINNSNKPFDKKRSGFLYSQGGSAILLIEELTHAVERDAKIIAEIAGYSENSDGYNIMVMEPDGQKIKELIINALQNAEINTETVDYINAHGTGTELNDEAESKIIKELFGSKPLINSTKSLIGHTLGASGAIEAIVCALSIRNKTTHVCKNLTDPVRDLNFVTEKKTYKINNALSLSFGFGGHNTALVLKEFK